MHSGLAERDKGIDTLTGSAGADLCVPNDVLGNHSGEIADSAALADSVVITDFDATQDRIQLGGAAEDFLLVQVGGCPRAGFARDARNLCTKLYDVSGGAPNSAGVIDGDAVLDLDKHFTLTLVDKPNRQGTVTDLTLQQSARNGLGHELSHVAQGNGLVNIAGRRDLQTSKASGRTCSDLLDLAVDDQDDGADPIDPAEVVETQGQGVTMTLGDMVVTRQGDARDFDTFENGIGLSEEAVLSTGDATHLPGRNACSFANVPGLRLVNWMPLSAALPDKSSPAG